METLPMPLDALRAMPGGLDEYRISAPREVAAMLRQLCDGNVQLNLNASDASVVAATVWAMDAERGNLGFNVDPNTPALQAVLECQEVVVVGYLDSVKVQFDVANLVLVRGARGCVLNCSYPRELFRFQRRDAYRVRPLLRGSPVARLHHSDVAEMELALRVIDVSIGGCALFLPDAVPPMQVGGLLGQVQIALDAETRLQVDLRLRHVTSLNAQARGVRLGCEFVRANAATLRTLQRFIDSTQKRAKLMSIG
jgi:c-di-GMP-binding flagellar brake protein YcgR